MAVFSVSDQAHRIFIEVALAGPEGVPIGNIWKLKGAEVTLPMCVKQLVWKVFFDIRHYQRKIFLSGSPGLGLQKKRLSADDNILSMEVIVENGLKDFQTAVKYETLRICPLEKFEFMVLGITTPKCTLTKANICALRYIAQFRKSGVLLTEVFKHLQKRNLSGLSKNSNHIIKTLEDEGLVVKILERNNHKAVNINRVTLRRFKPWDPSEKENTLAKQGGTLYLEKNFFQFYERLKELMTIIKVNVCIDKLVLSDVIKLVMEADSKRESSEFRHHRQSVLRDFLIKLWERGESIIEVKNLQTSYIKSKESTKKTRTQNIACCIIREKPISFKESVHYASILERKQFVREIREISGGQIGPKDGYSLYDQVLELIYDSGEKGIRVKDLNYITCAPPKYLYKLVKRIVEAKNTKLVWFKESGEAAQAHRRVFYKQFVKKGKKVNSRLEQNKAYLKEVVEYYKILNLQVLLSIMKKYEEKANNKRSDRRTILKHIKQLGYRMKDMDGPVQSNTGGKSKLIIWDPALISPDEKKLMDTFFEIKSDDRFKQNEKYSTKLHNKKVKKLKAYNTMSDKNRMKNVLIGHSDDEDESQSNVEEASLVVRILKKSQLREMVINRKGRDAWIRINQEFFFAQQTKTQSSNLNLEDLERKFKDKYPYPSYMDRVCKFHCELWEQTFGRDTMFDDDEKLELKNGIMLSKSAVDVSSCWKQMKLKKYFSTFRLSYKRKLLPRNYKTLMAQAEKGVTVGEMVKEDKEYGLFLSPTAIVNRFTQTLAEMGMLLTVKRDLRTGEVSTLAFGGAEGPPSLPNVFKREPTSDKGNLPKQVGKRSTRETHFLNYDDSRLDISVKQAVEKKEAVFQYVLLCDPRKSSSYFCGGGAVDLVETFKLRSVEDIQNFYADLKEKVREANIKQDGSGSFNVLQVGSFLNPIKWNIELRRGTTPRSKRSLNVADHPLSPNKLRKHSALSKFTTLADLTSVKGVEEQLKKIQPTKISALAAKPKKTIKEYSQFWKWFIENGGSVKKFIETHGYDALQYLDKVYEKDQFAKQEEYTQTYMGKIENLTSEDKEFIEYHWHKARSFLVFADDSFDNASIDVDNAFQGFKDDKLRVAMSLLKKQKIVQSPGSLFKDSPSMCGRVGTLHKNYYNELNHLISSFIGPQNIKEAKSWANRMDFSIENEKEYFKNTEGDGIAGAEFLALLCKSISQQFNLDIRFLDQNNLVIDDETNVFLTKEFDEAELQDGDTEKRDAAVEAPIIPTKMLSTYQPSFMLRFVKTKSSTNKAMKQSKRRLKPITNETLVLEKIREAGSIGVNANNYQSTNMKPLIDSGKIIKVPCFDHHRYVVIECINPWVIFRKGKKAYLKMMRERKKLLKTSDDVDSMSVDTDSSEGNEKETEIQGSAQRMGSLENAVQSKFIEFSIARKWIYCNGEVNQKLKTKFLQAILMNILSNPGIGKADLCTKLKKVLSPVDVEDLTAELLLKGLVNRRQFPQNGNRKYKKQLDNEAFVPVLEEVSYKWSDIFMELENQI